MKLLYPGKNITEINIETRHRIMFRLMTLIGQKPIGTRTDTIYLLPFIREGLDMTDDECRLTIRDAFISAKNVGLFYDVSLKSGRGYHLAVTYGGRRYFPYLRNAFPDEEERRKQYQLGDIIKIWEAWEREKGVQHADAETADQRQ